MSAAAYERLTEQPWQLRVLDLLLFGFWLCVVWNGRRLGEPLLQLSLHRSTARQRRESRTLSVWRWEALPERQAHTWSMVVSVPADEPG